MIREEEVVLICTGRSLKIQQCGDGDVELYVCNAWILAGAIFKR